MGICYGLLYNLIFCILADNESRCHLRFSASCSDAPLELIASALVHKLMEEVGHPCTVTIGFMVQYANRAVQLFATTVIACLLLPQLKSERQAHEHAAYALF